MIISELSDVVRRARLGRAVGPFTEVITTLTPSGPGADTVLLELELPAVGEVEVEWLHPFSWDAGLRGVITPTRLLSDGDHLCLHAGPYGTADAKAHLLGIPMQFPDIGDGHRYLAGDAPAAEDDHHDAAAWVLVRIDGQCLVVAWEYSGHLQTMITRRAGLVSVRCVFPIDTFSPATDSSLWGSAGPIGWIALLGGDLDNGAAAFRALVEAEVITAPDLSGLPGNPGKPRPEFPVLVANSWGVQENTSTETVLSMMDSTAAVGAEVFVVDKGWERAVGDWQANDRFPSGMRHLSDQARARGMGFGVWCGFGNADPQSPVALEHPDWLMVWRDLTPVLSFDNLGLCLGHEPARDWLLGQLRRVVGEFGLTWLIHDFETIARCDSTQHTHDPGAGEHAAEAAFHFILGALRREFPQLILENCWNGVRPLDLAMIRSHHTTITEDHCKVHWNSLAKVALGRYLPLDWQSAYMGAEDLPPKARIAPYVIGGPWVLMDDLAAWDEPTRATLARATEVFRAWRVPLRTAAVSRPAIDRATYDGVQAQCADGRLLIAASLPAGAAQVSVDLGQSGTWVVTDEWTSETSTQQSDDGKLILTVDPAGDGLLVSVTAA